MAQLKSTNIYGTLAVTDKISEGGSTLESKYLGIASKASSAATADSASSVPWSGVTNKVDATTSAAGLMSAADKIKLNGIASGANAYVLPTAAAGTLGGIKVGTNLSIDDSGVLSSTNTTYGAATTTYAGLVSTTAQSFGGKKTFQEAEINGSAGNSKTLFTVKDTATVSGTTSYAHAANFVAPNMVTGSNFTLNIGQGTAARNAAYIGFAYAGGSGSTGNYLKLGHYGADNQLIVRADGNVGIGTTAPGAKLEVAGSIKASLTGATFEVDDLTTYSGSIRNAAWFLSPNMGTGAKNAVFFGKTGNTRNAAFIGFSYTGSGSTGNYLRLGHYDANDQMIIRADGNVGIGTTAPAQKLEVNGNIKAQKIVLSVSGGTGNASKILDVTDTATISSGNFAHIATFYTPNMATGAKTTILFGKEGSNYNSSLIGFKYVANNSTGNYFRVGHWNADDRLIVRADGNVGIGTTTPSAKLEVSGTAKATSFVATSSRKLKKDIAPTLISALDLVNDVEIVDFKFKDDEKETPHVGFIAEDTPEILSTPDKNSIDYTNCIGVLMKAVQELSTKVEELEKKIK